jgi:hypothetical protein
MDDVQWRSLLVKLYLAGRWCIRAYVRLPWTRYFKRKARSFFRAVWPSFGEQDMLRWCIMHGSLVANVVCTRYGKRGIVNVVSSG